ncbi:DUF397 domain-containing protein [Streptomyces sp. NPDC090025]|uniref:DUF397 domain-containing protein n=1 Tax=Streptomyces sp. NPDC090025 TaxID=3365922 RepID=UPI003835D59B
MTHEDARTDKLSILRAIKAYDMSGVQWTKSSFSGGGGSGDCLEVARIPGLGYALRHSILTDHVIPLTDGEYAAYVDGVKADQPGLVPGA